MRLKLVLSIQLISSSTNLVKLVLFHRFEILEFFDCCKEFLFGHANGFTVEIAFVVELHEFAHHRMVTLEGVIRLILGSTQLKWRNDLR